MRKTYTYHLTLRNPVTLEMQVQTIDVDSDGEFLDARELLQAMHENNTQFDVGFVLIGMIIGDTKPLED